MQLWSLAGISAGIAIFASVADWRRRNRKNLNKVGFMPWALITMMAILAALILTAMALKVHQ